MKNKTENYLLLTLSLLVYLSYFLSYFFGEDSIGGGDNDLTWIWQNFEIFKSNDILSAIRDEKFFGNRTPLLYIINIYLNPFIENIDSYRFSIFIFFIISPIIFFYTLKKYFSEENSYILFCVSTFLLLSPYFRSSAVWGQEINYGILSLIVTFFYFIKFKKNEDLLNLFFTIFFSSVCVYFDQKLLIVPLFCFYYILFKSTLNPRVKLFSALMYFLFSIPFLYLISIWGGLVPTLTQKSNFLSFNSLDNFNVHYYHIGFAATLIALYLIPVIILKNTINLKIIYNFLKSHLLLILFPSFLYIFLYIYFDWYDLLQSKLFIAQNGETYGLGFANKLGLILFEDIFIRKIFTYLAFFTSWILIIYAIKCKATNWFLLTYFFIISLFLLPIMQEYFDPYIFLLSILMSSERFKFNFKRTFTSLLFFVMALSFAILYY